MMKLVPSRLDHLPSAYVPRFHRVYEIETLQIFAHITFVD